MTKLLTNCSLIISILAIIFMSISLLNILLDLLLYVGNHLSCKVRNDGDLSSRWLCFSVDVLKYDWHLSVNEFVKYISSYMFLSQIVYPTTLRNSCKTVVEDSTSVSSNVTATISDHPPQFLIVTDIFSIPLSTKALLKVTLFHGCFHVFKIIQKVVTIHAKCHILFKTRFED